MTFSMIEELTENHLKRSWEKTTKTTFRERDKEMTVVVDMAPLQVMQMDLLNPLDSIDKTQAAFSRVRVSSSWL